MSNIVEAEYTVEYERTLPVIIGEIKIIEQNTARIVLENGIQIGQRLQEAKEKVCLLYTSSVPGVESLRRDTDAFSNFPLSKFAGFEKPGKVRRKYSLLFKISHINASWE